MSALTLPSLYPHSRRALVDVRRRLSTAPQVPAEADVIVVEAASIGAPPLAAEQLLRRLLALPRRPAVVLVHMLAWCSEGAAQIDRGVLPGVGVGRH